jgi:hypothetical protein
VREILRPVLPEEAEARFDDLVAALRAFTAGTSPHAGGDSARRKSRREVSAFVVDASIAVKLVVDEPGTGQALRLREHSLAAADLLIAECALRAFMP